MLNRKYFLEVFSVSFLKKDLILKRILSDSQGFTEPIVITSMVLLLDNKAFFFFSVGVIKIGSFSALV